MFRLAGDNQDRKRGSVVCGAFLGVFQIKCPLLYNSRGGALWSCCILGRLFKCVEEPKSVTGNVQDSQPHHNSTVPKFPRLDYETKLRPGSPHRSP